MNKTNFFSTISALLAVLLVLFLNEGYAQSYDNKENTSYKKAISQVEKATKVQEIEAGEIIGLMGTAKMLGSYRPMNQKIRETLILLATEAKDYKARICGVNGLANMSMNEEEVLEAYNSTFTDEKVMVRFNAVAALLQNKLPTEYFTKSIERLLKDGYPLNSKSSEAGASMAIREMVAYILQGDLTSEYDPNFSPLNFFTIDFQSKDTFLINEGIERHLIEKETLVPQLIDNISNNPSQTWQETKRSTYSFILMGTSNRSVQTMNYLLDELPIVGRKTKLKYITYLRRMGRVVPETLSTLRKIKEENIEDTDLTKEVQLAIDAIALNE